MNSGVAVFCIPPLDGEGTRVGWATIAVPAIKRP